MESIPGSRFYGYQGPKIADIPLFSFIISNSSIFRCLFIVLLTFAQLKMNVLANVWRPIGKVDNPELVSLAVKCCLKQSVASGIGSMRSDIIGEIVYTMAGENSQLVGGKVVAKVLKVITL
jgi:hypothetical protein